MVPWRDFAAAAPDIAAAGRRLLQDDAGRPTVAFLATVGADARPRMHPFIPAVVDGGLWAFVIVSPKQRDLDRSGSYAIHSVVGRDDESFFVSGAAHRVEADARRSAVAAAMPYTDIDERHELYEFRIDRALWTSWTTPTSPVHRHWRLGG
jgi:hypothetical protein